MKFNWRDHDGEIFLATLYVLFKGAAAFTTPEQHFWYATLHGHSDDVLGGLLLLIIAKYFWERTSD